MIKKIFAILLLICFIIPQEPCNGHCLSDEQVTGLRNSILELEGDVEYNEN